MIVRAKILIQKLWKEGYEWDQILPLNILQMWTEIRNNIQDIRDKTKSNPHYITDNDSDSQDTTFHVFVDAS